MSIFLWITGIGALGSAISGIFGHDDLWNSLFVASIFFILHTIGWLVKQMYLT